MSSNKEAVRQRRVTTARVIRQYVELSKAVLKEHAPVEKTGKYRKVNPLTCGKAGCRFCSNPRRTYGRTTFEEQRSKSDMKEWIKHDVTDMFNQ